MNTLPLDWDEPDWDRYEKVHCWRNHVGHHTIGIWDTFTDMQKQALAIDAEYKASDEEWD